VPKKIPTRFLNFCVGAEILELFSGLGVGLTWQCMLESVWKISAPLHVN